MGTRSPQGRSPGRAAEERMLTVTVLVAIQIRLAFIHPEEIPFSNKCLGNPAAALLSSWWPDPPGYRRELSFPKETSVGTLVGSAHSKSSQYPFTSPDGRPALPARPPDEATRCPAPSRVAPAALRGASAELGGRSSASPQEKERGWPLGIPTAP